MFLLLQDIHKGDGLKNPINRVYSTNAAEPWHVDDADVVGESRLLLQSYNAMPNDPETHIKARLLIRS